MDQTYCIGNFVFRLRCPDRLTVPENFQKFAADAVPTYTYDIILAQRLPLPEGRIIAQRQDITVFATQTGEARLIGVNGNPAPYACYEEAAPDAARVTLAEDRIGGMSIDPMFVSLLALEKRLLGCSSMVLHTAFIVHEGEAILFSAPSETGKSTQAELWERYRGSRTVNGDRGLLCKADGRWTAGGWPVCGSSEICNVETYSIRAIVMLSQAREDRCRRLTPGEAFSQIYSQITVNRWNRADTVKAMDLLEDLVQSVPVYHLGCTISENAVACLEQALKEEKS